MLSARTILSDIASAKTTPLDAVAASLDAIDRLDAGIGAFAARGDRTAVLDDAGRATGPLAGIAVGIKDIFDTWDLETTYGSDIFAGHRPANDAALVALLRAAGATVVGKTVTTEFAYLAPAGTRNPRNPEHTPGGSSSGSAAAVAAGMVPAAIGTQTGGSVIRPASFCGVAAFKPSFRLLPTTGMKTFSWSLDTAGLFAARVADLGILAAGITGRALGVEPVDPASLRIGVYRSAVDGEASQAMQAAVAHAGEIAERAGASVVDLTEPLELTEGRLAHGTVQDYEAGIALADDLIRHGDRMSAVLRATLEAGRAIAPELYDAQRAIARRARKRATGLFQDVDVLLAPSAAGAAPQGLASTGSPIFNKLWTLTGNPCVNVPGLLDPSGLPLGLQVICRFGRDRLALSVGGWLEALVDAEK